MDHQSGAAVVRIASPDAHMVAVGELDLATTPTLTVQLGEAVAAGCRNFRVDLGGVSFCDASTIGLLVSLDQRLRATDGSLSIVAASSCVRRVLQIVGLERLLVPTVDPPDWPAGARTASRTTA